MLLESSDMLLRALSPSGRPLTSSGKIFITGSDATRRHGAVESARAETAVAGQENTRIRTGHAIEVKCLRKRGPKTRKSSDPESESPASQVRGRWSRLNKIVTQTL